MSTRRKKPRVLIATEASRSSAMRGDVASSTREGQDAPSFPRAKALTSAALSEPERRWRRQEILRVLAEILRNPDGEDR